MNHFISIQCFSTGDSDSLNVKIVAEYTAPPGFSLSAPSYPAATPLSLTCVVLGLNGEEIPSGITYEWTSTCSSPGCFLGANETSRTVSSRYLSAGDSGVYMCKAWDLAGCTGNTSIVVDVKGQCHFVLQKSIH